ALSSPPVLLTERPVYNTAKAPGAGGRTVSTMVPEGDGGDGRTSARRSRRTPGPLRPDDRARAADRAAGLDAGRLPRLDDPPDRPARPLGDHRHAAGGQLDHPGALAAPQG